jgi:outer membrane protein TolC
MSMIVFVILIMLPRIGVAETLEDAWKIAVSVDRKLKASHRNVQSRQFSLSAAKASRLPSLAIESGYTILNNEPAAKLDDPPAAITRIPTAEDKSFFYKTTVTLPLFTGGRISRGIDAASSGLNSVKQDEIKTEQDVKLQVAEAYVEVLRARRIVASAENNVTSLTSHAKDVGNFYEQGIVTRNDLLSSQVSLADARQRLTQALNNLDLARASYNRLLGRPLDHEVRIDDLIAEKVKTDITELTSQALTRRPELISLSEQTHALRHQAAGVRASAMPQLELSGGYNYQQNKFQVHEDIWSATMGLRWELFDGGISRHSAAALLQKADALSEIRADTASVIALQVRQACLDIEESSKRIEVTREAVTQSEENLRVVKDRYREGVGTNTEVLDAETLRTKSRSNHDNAVYDAVMATIRLRYAVGDL